MKPKISVPLARVGFRTHLLIYTVFGLLLMSANFMLTPHELWFHWPLLLWGLGMVVHAVISYRRRVD